MASAARDALPDKRFADAYLSADGIAELVAAPAGPLATLSTLVNPDASEGVAVALVAGDDELELAVRSELAPRRAKRHPGFFSAFPAFDPDLAGLLPGDTLGYLGFGDPGKTSQLAAEAGEAPPSPGWRRRSATCSSGSGSSARSISSRTSCPRWAARPPSRCSRPRAARRSRSSS